MTNLQLILTLLLNLIALLAGVTAGIRWLRGWLRKQVVEPAQRIESEVSTKSNHTLGQVVEDLGAKMQAHVNALGTRFNGIEHDLRPLEDIVNKLNDFDDRFSILDKRITQTSDVALYALSNASQALEKLQELERN